MNWNLRQQWALTQGLLGARQKTLLPSLASLGRTTYLQQNDFFKMIGMAMLLHAIILGIVALWPEERVTDIPVRALTFKIGAGARIAPPLQVGQPRMVPSAPIAMAPQAPKTWRAAPAAPKPQPKPVKPAKIVPVAPTPVLRQAPMENPLPAPAPAPAPRPPSALPDTSVLTQAAIAPTPQRYIREYPGQQGQAGTAPVPSPMEAAQVARARYEQEISAWILRHYPQNIPPGQRKLRPVVRMRIDRAGNLRYYAIEQSSGIAAIDAAAVDMIRRANPLPAVPQNYPAGNLIEFLIPIVFRVP